MAPANGVLVSMGELSRPDWIDSLKPSDAYMRQ